MPLAWVSCAGSRFLETNHEFVQSNECEARRRSSTSRKAIWSAASSHAHRVSGQVRSAVAKSTRPSASSASE